MLEPLGPHILGTWRVRVKGVRIEVQGLLVLGFMLLTCRVYAQISESSRPGFRV